MLARDILQCWHVIQSVIAHLAVTFISYFWQLIKRHHLLQDFVKLSKKTSFINPLSHTESLTQYNKLFFIKLQKTDSEILGPPF